MRLKKKKNISNEKIEFEKIKKPWEKPKKQKDEIIAVFRNIVLVLEHGKEYLRKDGVSENAQSLYLKLKYPGRDYKKIIDGETQERVGEFYVYRTSFTSVKTDKGKRGVLFAYANIRKIFGYKAQIKLNLCFIDTNNNIYRKQIEERNVEFVPGEKIVENNSEFVNINSVIKREFDIKITKNKVYYEGKEIELKQFDLTQTIKNEFTEEQALKKFEDTYKAILKKYNEEGINLEFLEIHKISNKKYLLFFEIESYSKGITRQFVCLIEPKGIKKLVDTGLKQNLIKTKKINENYLSLRFEDNQTLRIDIR